MKGLRLDNNRIGKTPLLPATSLSKDFSLPNIFIKDESTNPSGTIKDRRNEFILHEAQRLRIDKLVLITSGNNGLSLSLLAKDTDSKVVCVVDRTLSEDIITKLKQHAYQVIEVNLQHKILRPEEIIAFAREREDEVIWDVTNGYEESYAKIVAELRDERPDFIVVPVGSGEIFVGIVEGIERYRLATKVIGIGVQNTLKSFADKLHTPWTPYTRALEAMQHRGHYIYRLSEEEVKQTYTNFQNIVKCEPSSASVFAALKKHPFRKEEKIVFINSGRSLT